MPTHSSSPSSLWIVVAALVCAAGTWTYAERVLIPYQVADAAAHGRPRGNLSDLYPRWLGARELLLHGRDPYSAEVTREIQEGYYGRPLDRARAGEPRDEERFAYPVYVAFVLAPTVRAPFAAVETAFFWVLLLLTLGSAWLWMRLLGWRCEWPVHATVLLLTAGSLAVMQGVKLQQMTLLVAAMIAAAVYLLTRKYPVPAGILLGFATIKPQLAAPLLLWLAIWTLADLRWRWRWLASFAATMGVLCAASERLLPHWLARFWQALGAYERYTGAVGVLEKLVGAAAGRALEAVALAVTLAVCWKERRVTAESRNFAVVVSMILACTVLLAPTYAEYNQVLLLPAVLVIFEQRGELWRRGAASRVLLAVTAALLCWPWISGVALAACSLLLGELAVEGGWAAPFWTALLVPVGVAAVMLICEARRSFAAARADAS